ncbi:MAG: hypothetical protein COB67_08485 [SAR324 cluster bacterium]|uniref:RecBCD enzyme subunit RecD N-terminal domain-containing protein n=1 Tax=SAR324 cluster bacterium TaxID=2024889 RepID=A0A2A4T1Q9_9DELT|nr:MAG: hypothetical protein COB67_08485 [SAR324 cluster bacterium]
MSLDLDFFRNREFQPLDHHFAKKMVQLAFPEGDQSSDEMQMALYLASGLVCFEAAKGNVCLHLQDYAAEEMKVTGSDGEENSLLFPALESWIEHLQQSRIVGDPETRHPLILEVDTEVKRLYLNRYYQYEQGLASFIRQRLKPVNLDEQRLQKGLDRLFPSSDSTGIDYQRLAAERALSRKFSVISGGPGTGKTTAVLKILSLLIEQADDEVPRIRLAAPTGKAAARLKESIQKGKQRLLGKGQISQEIYELLQEETSTIHPCWVP